MMGVRRPSHAVGDIAAFALLGGGIGGVTVSAAALHPDTMVGAARQTAAILFRPGQGLSRGEFRKRQKTQ
jgi:hypothetical protein